MTTAADAPAAATLKQTREQAERSMRDGDYARAFVLWSRAMQLIAPRADAGLLSQRSKCLLRLEQFHHALQDAAELVRLCPDASVGHARRAEVLLAARQFDAAHAALLKCFQLAAGKADKELYMEQLKRCRREAGRERALHAQYPWVGAAIGLVVSALGVAADAAANRAESLIAHPLLKVALVVGVALTCYAFALKYRDSMVDARRGVLEKPVRLVSFDDDDDDVGDEEKKLL